MDEYANLRFSRCILFTCTSQSPVPAGLVFLPIYERLYPGALYPFRPLVYYFFTAYPLISSRSQWLFALCTSSAPSLHFSLSVFSPPYKCPSPSPALGEIQCRNKFHVRQKNCTYIFFFYYFRAF